MSDTSNDSASSGGFFDVIIIGAGISGINAGYRIHSQLPEYRYAILEARESMGGTWDIFRYPGVRSDSDLFTFGFEWNPWKKDNPIADGESIRRYIEASASLHGIDHHIRYKHSVSTASWSSKEQLWTLLVQHGDREARFTSRFLIFSTGYYNYQEPLHALIPGIDTFRGKVVHPQFWPEDLDCKGKRAIIIGSGATAVTLLPSLAKVAAKVTMLQRSPTYILSRPNRSCARSWVGYLVPDKWYHQMQRLSSLLSGRLFVVWCLRFPSAAKNMMKKATSAQLPSNLPYEPHFSPRYSPWHQRLCLSPDGDFFDALRSGAATVETGNIQRVVADGILLNSGKMLDADLIVTATGLRLLMGGGVKIKVDGHDLDLSEKLMWNGVMIQDVPNAAFVLGYTNASWTLGADVTAQFACRFLRHLQARGKSAAVPSLPESAKFDTVNVMKINSTYVKIGAKDMPKSAERKPWTGRTDYFSDLAWVKLGSLERGLRYIGTDDPKRK